MSGLRCTCPACKAALNLRGDVTAGKEITCPKCNANFPIPDQEEAAVVEAVSARDEDDFEEQVRPPRRRKRPAPSGMSPVLILVLVLAIVLGAGGVVVGGVWLGWKYLANTSADVAKAESADKAAPAVPPLPIIGGRAALNPGQPGGDAGPIVVGKEAPEIEGEDLEGHRFKLSDYRGKVVVLDFWGHW